MTDRTRGLLALLALTLIWGYSWVMIKAAVAHAGPFTLAAHRSLVAALALFATLKILGRPLKPSAPGAMALIGLVQTTVFLSLQGAALTQGGAGKTAVLVYTMPVWTLLLSVVFLGERIRLSQVLAGVLTLFGLTLIIAPWRLESSVLAQGLAVAAAVAWSAGTILSKRLSRRGPVDVLNLNAWQCLVGSLLLFPVSALAPGPVTVWTLGYVGLVAGIGVLVTAVGWALWSFVLKRLPAWQASLSVLGVPAVALLTSRLQTGEAVDELELAGMLLIGGGLVLLSLLNWQAERRLAAAP